MNNMDESQFYPDSVGKSNVPIQGLKCTKSRGSAVKGEMMFLVMNSCFLGIHIHKNSYLSKNYAILPVPSHNIFKIWLGIDAMASKDTQRRLVKENKNRPRDPNVLDVRTTVSSKSPSSDLKCPMHIIIFLGQDDHFYLFTKSSLNHCHHPALKADAILRGQNDMEQGDLDLLLLLFSVNATGIQISEIM
jgi:hypothetical protein